MSEFEELLGVLVGWGLVAGLGAVVSLYGWRVYRRHHERSMGFLALGFVAISGVAAVAWFGLYFLGMDPLTCEMGSTLTMSVGFGSILFGLRTRSP